MALKEDKPKLDKIAAINQQIAELREQRNALAEPFFKSDLADLAQFRKRTAALTAEDRYILQNL